MNNSADTDMSDIEHEETTEMYVHSRANQSESYFFRGEMKIHRVRIELHSRGGMMQSHYFKMSGFTYIFVVSF